VSAPESIAAVLERLRFSHTKLARPPLANEHACAISTLLFQAARRARDVEVPREAFVRLAELAFDVADQASAPKEVVSHEKEAAE